MHDSGIRAARLNAVFIPLVLFFGTMAVSIVLLRGGYMVSDHLLELATLSTFTTYAVGIFEPIQMTAANIAEFISLQASIERVMDLMDKTPQIQDTPEVIEKYGDAFHPKRENWEPIRGEIEFRDVTFRYPDGGGNVLGVYVHGLFEDEAVLQALFGAGAPSLDAVFDQLAANVERAFAPGVLQGLIQ